MEVSEDGTVTGSIDVSKLDEIEPKTDEAKAQIDALKAEVAAGQEPAVEDDAEDSDAEVTPKSAPQPDEEQPVEPQDDSELEQLRAEAEALGVKVDKRWGADRLRAEIAAARAQ
jgi:sRNA-binding protein